MALSRAETDFLVSEISRELGAKRDGGGKNLIAPKCPFCGKDGGKFGIYIGKETARRKPFMSHCFSCGYSTFTLEKLLEGIGRFDLIVKPTADIEATLESNLLFRLDIGVEVDDTLGIVELPDFYKRCFSHPYLKLRGFTYDDYEYFPVGTTDRLNKRFDHYVIFPVIDAGDIVAYVARHIWSKPEIDQYNRRAIRTGDYKIMRFRNSTENDFVKLLYNYDAVIESETHTVVIVEGIFDVVALTRKLDYYDNCRIAVVATFGKKISQTQIFKLQNKKVKEVIIGYDGDAVDSIKRVSDDLSQYFKVLIADIPDPEKDWEDLTVEEIKQIFTARMKTPLEYKISKVQEL